MTELMSVARQNELIDFTQEVIEKVAANVTPTDALIDVAKQRKLNADEIQRVKEGYNTAAALHQIKTGETPEETVPLADGERAVEVLFPGGEDMEPAEEIDVTNVNDVERYREGMKVAKVAKAQLYDRVHTGELVPESMTFYEEDPGRSERLSKAAEALMPKQRYGVERTAEEQRQYLLKRAEDLEMQLESEVEQLRDAATRHRWKLAEAIDRFAERFTYTDAPPFAEVEKVAKSFEKGIEIPLTVAFQGGRLAKLGHSRYTGELLKYADADEYAAERAQLRQVRNAFGTLIESRAQHHKAAQQLEQLRVRRKQAVFGDPTGTLQGLFSDAQEAEGGLGVIAPPTAHLNDEVMSQLGQDRLRVLLSNLTTDPVISTHDPDQVAQSLNELLSARPQLADNEMNMRAAMRRYLAGGGDLSLHEIGQLQQIGTEAPKTLASPS